MNQQRQIPAAEGARGNGQSWEISQAYMIQSFYFILQYFEIAVQTWCCQILHSAFHTCWLKYAYPQHWQVVIYKSALYLVHTAQSPRTRVKPRTPLAWAASALSLSHDSRRTNPPHNPLYILHRWYWMPQSHTWQPLSMCHQNSVRGRPENSLCQERTHAEWSSHSKCSEHQAGNKWI